MYRKYVILRVGITFGFRAFPRGLEQSHQGERGLLYRNAVIVKLQKKDIKI